MSRLKEIGIKGVIPAKRGRGQKIRNELRKESDRIARESGIYKKRVIIEGVFSEIKQKLVSHIRTRDGDIAKKIMLVRFAIYNFYQLAMVEGGGNIFVIIWQITI